MWGDSWVAGAEQVESRKKRGELRKIKLFNKNNKKNLATRMSFLKYDELIW